MKPETSQEYEINRWNRNNELWASRRSRWAAWRLAQAAKSVDDLHNTDLNSATFEMTISEETRKEIADYYDRKTFNGD